MASFLKRFLTEGLDRVEISRSQCFERLYPRSCFKIVVLFFSPLGSFSLEKKYSRNVRIYLIFFLFQNTNIQQLKDEMKTTNSNTNTNTNTGTLRHRHKKSRPAPPPPINVPKPNTQPTSTDIEIRDPCELLVEAGTPLKAQWKHKPITLITSSVNYIVNVSQKRPYSKSKF